MKQRDEKKETRGNFPWAAEEAAHGHLCGAGADDDGRSHNCICSG